jgi:hypothetical protein
MIGAVRLGPADRAALGELAPVLRRAVELDRRAIVRLRLGPATATVLVRLPFGVLVSRSVAISSAQERDVALGAAETLVWLDDPMAHPPTPRDAEWRSGLPPAAGWRRLESVPDHEVRALVRSGALAVKQAAEREGVPGAQPRGEVADALLDSVVLTVTDESTSAGGGAADIEVTLRTLSALTRMGFVPRGGEVHVDVSGRWTRVVGAYGTVYAERGPGLLGLRVR